MTLNLAKTICAISITFFIGLVLTIMPMPTHFQWARPEWITLILIYWALYYPNYVGIMTAFFLGIMVDVLSGGLLGQTALALSLVAFSINFVRVKIRTFRHWQQALAILLLVAFKQLIMAWLQWIVGHPPTSTLYWLSSVFSVMLWPVLYLFMQAYLYQFNIR